MRVQNLAREQKKNVRVNDEERSTQRLRGADEKRDEKKKAVKAAELSAKRCLYRGHLVGHIEEVIPASQRAASAVGQAAPASVPSIWARLVFRRRHGSSPVCELSQITNRLSNGLEPKILALILTPPWRSNFSTCAVAVGDPRDDRLQAKLSWE